MSKINLLIEKFATFKHFAKVHKIENRIEFAIVDYDNTSYVVQKIDTENTYLINPENSVILYEPEKLFWLKNIETIVFVPIDGTKNSLMTGDRDGEGHCDVVVFDEQHFCFIELKLNATSLAESAVTKNRWKAINQIERTLVFLDKKFNLDYAGLDLEAYVATIPTYPRQNAEWQNISVAFLEKNGFQVFEATEKNKLL